MQVNIIHNTDCISGLRTLPDQSVHTCITSPPYYGLRDYGVPGQIGLEETPDIFIQKMVEVFREVKRVLRDDGTLWMNMGDSYAGRWGNYSGQNRHKGTQRERRTGSKFHNHAYDGMEDFVPPTAKKMNGIKPKDMMGIPWMLAFALRADGWYLRQDIIWHKPNPMPESVYDRCTKAHEYIFLLSKSSKYYYDYEAIMEPVSPGTHARLSQNIEAQVGSARANDGKRPNGNMKAVGNNHQKNYKQPTNWDTEPGHHGSFVRDPGRNPRPADNKGGNQGTEKGIPYTRKLEQPGSGTKSNTSFDEAMAVMPENRNKRSVWTVVTQGFKEAHFATFPERLIQPCILAGAPVDGIVLDPFMGSGTTALVSRKLNRNYVGFELNPEYITIAEKRLNSLGLFK